jgi:3-isopropylmalate/(R)-2-methylmalate dehydratase small subunit
MEPFRTVTGVAIPLLVDNIDTDQIAPASDQSRRLDPDYAALFFAGKRRHPDGSEDSAFILNRGPFRTARILVTGENFGCGSARETAVWSLAAFGIRCIVARSFAERYRENCLRNGILPVVLDATDRAAFEAAVVAADGATGITVDLRDPHVDGPDGRRYTFTIDASDRLVLLEGTDLVDLTLRQSEAIAAWETRTRRRQPWLQDVGT